MPGASEFRAGTARVASLVTRASCLWNPSDLKALEQCRETIEAAIKELRAMQAEAPKSSGDSDCVQLIAEARLKVGRLRTLTDAAVVFRSRMSAMIGDSPAAAGSATEVPAAGWGR